MEGGVDSISHVSGVPRQGGEYDDVEEEHAEDVVEREAILAASCGVSRHSLLSNRYNTIVAVWWCGGVLEVVAAKKIVWYIPSHNVLL